MLILLQLHVHALYILLVSTLLHKGLAGTNHNCFNSKDITCGFANYPSHMAIDTVNIGWSISKTHELMS